MGMYLNPGNAGFQSILKDRYVDKTGLIEYINSTLGTPRKLTCVSRPRRFGKSFAAKMLCAYYDRSCDSHDLFRNLNIAGKNGYEEHLNQYDVLYLDMTWFISNSKNIGDTVKNLQSAVIKEIKSIYTEFDIEEKAPLPVVLATVSEKNAKKFIVIIDEWDALFREARENTALQGEYVQLLRGIFGSSQTDKMIEAAYMTGILPIKKYGNQSALSDFYEFTMIDPVPLEEYVGFTELEVRELCTDSGMDFAEVRRWYDGYLVGNGLHVYSPKSVLDAITRKRFGNYWTQTETYESLKAYINMNFDGLKDAVIAMLGGERCRITTRRFQNDMTSVKSKDDVMTLLVHLGYLAFDFIRSEVFIPNQEVAGEFENAVEDGGWEALAAALNASEGLLQATIRGDAKGIEDVHMVNTSVLSYNDENSLSCAITIAYYSARKDYALIRELPSGKGYADIAFLPRKHSDKPAMIVELKWDKSAEGAIRQIKEKRYDGVLKEYGGEVILVGINYDRGSKKHECVIEYSRA